MCSRSAIKSSAASLSPRRHARRAARTYYFDRRDTVSIVSGEAMATNRVTHMIDPWSRASGNRNIAYNGEKAQTAPECYRTGQRHNAGGRNHEFGANMRNWCSATSRTARAPVGAGADRQLQQASATRQEQPMGPQRLKRNEQDRGGGADRRSGVRAVGPIDVRRQRSDRAARYLRHRREVGDRFDPGSSTVVIVDVDVGDPVEMEALERMMLRIERGRRWWW